MRKKKPLYFLNYIFGDVDRQQDNFSSIEIQFLRGGK